MEFELESRNVFCITITVWTHGACVYYYPVLIDGVISIIFLLNFSLRDEKFSLVRIL